MPKIIIGNWGRKRKSRNNLEEQLQAAVFQWAALNEAKEPRLKFLFAVPNGGLRNIIVAAKLKRQGVKRGVPDIIMLCPVFSLAEGVIFHGLCIEMKAGKNKPSPEQMEWIDFLRKQEYRVVVCWKAEDAIREIETYLGMAPQDRGGRG